VQGAMRALHKSASSKCWAPSALLQADMQMKVQ
jgi:hypothetical protein